MRLPMPTLVATLGVLAALSPASWAADGPTARKPTIACEGNEKNLQTYLQIHKVLFTERDSSRVLEFYAPEVLSHNQDSGGNVVTKVKAEQMGAMWAASKKFNPDRVLADDLIVCAGDYVTVRTMVHNSDTTGVEGNPPTGKSYVISAIDIYRFENGKVVERWGNADLVSMFRQIGYTMTPPASLKAAPAKAPAK
jgi:predicted ester cyclase